MLEIAIVVSLVSIALLCLNNNDIRLYSRRRIYNNWWNVKWENLLQSLQSLKSTKIMYILQLVTENRCGLIGNFMEEIVIEAKKIQLKERGGAWWRNAISKEDKRKKYEVDENSDLICLI